MNPLLVFLSYSAVVLLVCAVSGVAGWCISEGVEAMLGSLDD